MSRMVAVLVTYALLEEAKSFSPKRKKPGPKYLQSTSKPKTYKICSNCNGHLSRGINHKCWQTNKAKNTVRLAETQGTKEQVASTIIRDKQSGNDCDMTLKSLRGKSLRIRLKPKDKRQKIISHKDIDAIASKTGVSSAKGCKNLAMKEQNTMKLEMLEMNSK